MNFLSWFRREPQVPAELAPYKIEPKKPISAEMFAAVVSKQAKDPDNILSGLNDACIRYGVTTPMRAAMFLAQWAHESGGFQYTEEIWGPTPAQRGYEGRKDLGNVFPGDGFRYRGRGWAQLTGRDNYTKAALALTIDFVGQPDLAALPHHAAVIAGWYWDSRRINKFADAGDFVAVTKAINGGTNGLADRVRYLRIIARTINLDLSNVRLS